MVHKKSRRNGKSGIHSRSDGIPGNKNSGSKGKTGKKTEKGKEKVNVQNSNADRTRLHHYCSTGANSLPGSVGLLPATEPWPHTTPETAREQIAEIRRKNPWLETLDAVMLNVYRGCAEVSMRFADSNGGGRYPRFLKLLEKKYGRKPIH